MSRTRLGLRTSLMGTALVLTTVLGLFACWRDDPLGPSGRLRPPRTQASLVDDPNAVVLIGAGNIARCDRLQDEATAQLLAGTTGTVFTLGDNVYGGTLADYQNCYGASWGQYLAQTRPSPGEDDYPASGPYGYYGYFGAAAGDPSKGYYSYDLGSSWHIVVLNSSIDMSSGSAQESWLKADLAGTSKSCILAYWHFPRFSSYQGLIRNDVKPLWDDLYAAGADVVLNGHFRFYERYAPQTPAGVADSAKGLRQFIVGTGGEGEDGITGMTPLPNSQVIIGGVDGVLKLTLHDWTYDWQFISLPEQNRSDAGTGLCHGRPNAPRPNQAPTADPGGPYVSERDVVFDASKSYDIDRNTPLSYTWTFSDGTTAKGVNPTRSYAVDGSYSATLVVTDALGLASAPAPVSVTIRNLPPVVDAGPDQTTVTLGTNYAMNATWTDPGGTGDQPWTWTILWGDGVKTTGSTKTLGAAINQNHKYAAGGTYTARLNIVDKNGATGTDSALVQVRDSRSSVVLVGAGDIAECGDPGSEKTAQLLDTLPGTVITLGDNAYLSGTYTEFMTCYDPTWGRHKARTRPALGNHEVVTPDAAGYFQYFGTVAGDPSKGYYAYSAGEWLVLVLNSAGGSQTRSATSPQVQWLKAELAGAVSANQCVLAYMHHPQFTSTEGRNTGDWGVIDLWNALYDGGADLVLNGHDHLYDRFAPQRPDGTLDTQYGIRQITVGTGGGEGLNSFKTTPWPNSEKRISSSFGVVRLTLKSGAYTWQWIPVAGGTETDSGSGTCHGRPDGTRPANQAPVAKPGGPYASEGTVRLDGTASYDPENQVPLSYYWNFGDGTYGSGATPTHTWKNGSYNVSLVVTDLFGAKSTAVTTRVTIANQAPVVNAGADSKAFAGSAFTFAGTFTDAGGSADAPFAWTIAWGDGTTATTGSTSANGDVVSAPHTYAATGTFTVRLTVKDKDGATAYDDRVVTVSPPNRAPVAVVGGPYTSEATVAFDGSASSDPDGDAITWAWDFGDGTTGTGAKPVKSYTVAGTYTVTLVVTDAYGLSSAPATTTATVTNQPPAVSAGLDALIQSGDNYSASATFTDGGSTDSPWSWTIDWGDGSPVSSGTATASGTALTGSHGYGAPGAYTVRVTVTDANGAAGVDEATVRVGADVLVGAGSIARCDRAFDEQTAALLGKASGTIASIGDAVQSGAASDYANCYGPSWGQQLSRTRPAPGENEYLVPDAYYGYFGAAAGDPTQGYYSYDIGSSWHIVVLNSSIAMGTGSAQELWLKADLAANTKQCVLAYWHFPRFTAYNGSLRNDVKPLWDDLYAAGADVILNGHGQFYERYAQQTPAEVADPNGIREFIVGTGGQGLTDPSLIMPRVNSQVRIVGTYGVLALALDAGSYSWQFVPVAGSTATDAGTTSCH